MRKDEMMKTTSLTTTRSSVVELDGFDDFTNEVEGVEERMSSKVIEGTKIKFIDPRWLNAKTGQDITGKHLTVVGVRNVINKWGPDNELLDIRILAPGEKFPNFDKLNAECRNEWRTAFGKEVGPWSGQHVIYFVDELWNPYTWPSPTSTAGSSVCVDELMTQIKRVRSIRGDRARPLVELNHTDWPTGYGLKQRPQLVIVKWVVFGADRMETLPPTEMPSIPGPASSASIPPTAAAKANDVLPDGAQLMTPITPKEELRDEIPW